MTKDYTFDEEDFVVERDGWLDIIMERPEPQDIKDFMRLFIN